VITGGDSGNWPGGWRLPTPARGARYPDRLIFDEHEDGRTEVKALIEQEGRKAVLVAGDLRPRIIAAPSSSRPVEALGGVDILVNNAAHQATFKGHRRHQR